MNSTSSNKSVNVAIVNLTDSDNTSFISALAMQTVQEGYLLSPAGDNQHQTLQSIQSNWKAFKEGICSDSIPDALLIELPWELSTQYHKAPVQFIERSGQEMRSLFGNLNPDNLDDDLKNVYGKISNANLLVFNINMEDLQKTSDCLTDLINTTIHASNGSPRKIAVVFNQFDKFKSEVDQQFNNDFSEYLHHNYPNLHELCIQNQNLEIIPVANACENVVENGEANPSPVTNISSFSLGKLTHWLVNSVDELEPVIQNNTQSSFSAATNQSFDSSSSSESSDSAVPHPEQLLRPSPKYSPSSFIFLWMIIALLFIPEILHSLLLMWSSFLHIDISDGMAPVREYLTPLRTIKPYCTVTAYVLMSFLLYRCWKIIQDGYAWIIPGLVFISIPFFLDNLWMSIFFVLSRFLYSHIPYRYIPDWLNTLAYTTFDNIPKAIGFILLFGFLYCLSISFNKYSDRHSLKIQPCSSNLILTSCILLLLIPFIRIILFCGCYYLDYWTFHSTASNFLLSCMYIILLNALFVVARTARDIQLAK